MRHTILHADVMDGLRSLPDACVQCVVTSPPYWGLRDYGVEGQIGLEPSPEEYVQKIVAVFREVWRVLRHDGTLWLNYGDCYARSRSAWGLKAKDLVGMPWRVAFALQADGWTLRSDIIWRKPNPMPESVRDRPTKSHEYLFLLTKGPRYFYDVDAIREKTGNEMTQEEYQQKTAQGATWGTGGIERHAGSYKPGEKKAHPLGRNRRDVWRIATSYTPDAHFATFPEKLVEPCIKAGTSERGACPECGAPWRRVVEIERSDVPRYNSKSAGRRDCNYGDSDSTTLRARKIVAREVGWQPSCACGCEETVPCTVLDPFVGSGTVSLVAHGLGRSSVGIELNGKYIDIIRNRWARGGLPAEALEVRAI